MLFPDFSPLDFLSVSGNAARLKAFCLQSCLAVLSVSLPRQLRWVPEHPCSSLPQWPTNYCTTSLTHPHTGPFPPPGCSPTFFHSLQNYMATLLKRVRCWDILAYDQSLFILTRLACSRFKWKTTCIVNTSSSLLPSHTPNHYQSAKCINIPVVKPTVTRETTKKALKCSWRRVAQSV